MTVAASYERYRKGGRRKRLWPRDGAGRRLARGCIVEVYGDHLSRLPDGWRLPATWFNRITGRIGCVYFSQVPGHGLSCRAPQFEPRQLRRVSGPTWLWMHWGEQAARRLCTEAVRVYHDANRGWCADAPPWRALVRLELDHAIAGPAHTALVEAIARFEALESAGDDRLTDVRP